MFGVAGECGWGDAVSGSGMFRQRLGRPVVKYPPEYATMSYAQVARWHAERAARLARVGVLLSVLSVVSALSTIAIMLFIR